MRTRVVIQSRLSSSRLPGKALMTLAGYPLIELVARRASRSGFEVVVATSVEPYDDLIADHLGRVGIPVVRGPLDDVLQRFVAATSDLDPDDRVVRLTGDNPVGDADLVQELIDAMAAGGHVYGRVDIEQVPEGLGAEVFTADILRRAGVEATDPYDREHVTPWIRRHCGGELLFAPASNPGDPVAYRCTTDCLHDYDRVARLFGDAHDPIGVSWSSLVGRLKGEVDALGPRAQALGPHGLGLSEVLLDATDIARMSGGGRDMAVSRETFTDALDRGVSHVYSAAADLDFVRSATLPALNKRLHHVVELEATDDMCDVRVEVERAFAAIGQRQLAGLVLPSGATREAWDTARGYVDEGLVGFLGAMHPDGVEPPEQAELIVFDREPTADVLDAMQRAGKAVAVRGERIVPGGVATILRVGDPAALKSALADLGK